MRVSLLILSVLCIIGNSTALAESFVVYDEPPIKYPWTGYVGSGNGISITVDPFNADNPQSGGICCKVTYNNVDEESAGVFVQYTGSQARGPGIGPNLEGMKKLVFFAKGAHGGENVSFGYGYDTPSPNGESDSSYLRQMENLKDTWVRYEYSLSGKDLTHINGLFTFYLERKNNPKGATFYLDNIQYID